MANHRFLILDGLRGIGAMIIAVHHTGAYWHFQFPRSYLAVDLFFLLSGFVLAHVHDEKLRDGRCSARDFLVLRLIRLLPDYWLSVLVSAFALLTYVAATDQATVGYGAAALAILMSLFLLPSVLPERNNLFPLDGPVWSLFYTLIVNAVYAACNRFLTPRALAALVLVTGAACSFAVAVHGNMDVGAQASLASAGAALCRASFGFFWGLALFRNPSLASRKLTRFLPPWSAFAILVAAVCIPGFGVLDPVIDIFVVVCIFPNIIAVATKPLNEGVARRAAPVLLALGAASYPLYLMHKPLGEFVARVLGDRLAGTAPWSGVALFAGLFLFCVWLERRVDIPLRKFLTHRLVGARRPAASAQVAKPGVG
jgi:peptidoglycan/LPS O-acetylase OafA/YrhL